MNIACFHQSTLGEAMRSLEPHPYNSNAQMLFYYTCPIWQHPHNFETKIFAFFHQLVVSMISKVSTLASKHLCTFAHCPYHARSVSTVAYHHNTHCPHHFRPWECMLLTSFPMFYWWRWGLHCHPWIFQIHDVVLGVIWGQQGAFKSSPLQPFVIITTTYKNIIFRKV